MRKFFGALVTVAVLSSMVFTVSAAESSVESMVEVVEEVDAEVEAEISKDAAAESTESAEATEEATEEVDAIASASVADFYAANAIAGDELMDAMNSFSGFYAISTVNEDGSPLVGFFVYGCVKHEDKYYLQFGLAENQTRENLVRTGEAVAMYAAAPSDQPFATSGARMWCKLVTDEELLAKINPEGIATALMCEVTAVRSLG